MEGEGEEWTGGEEGVKRERGESERRERGREGEENVKEMEGKEKCVRDTKELTDITS